VIHEGTKLSTLAQSQESLARCLITLVVGTLADIIGRRKALLIGLAAVTISSYTFIVASFVPAWAHVLFVVAQGLQGFSGCDLLSVVVAGDLAAAADGDSTKAFMMKDMACLAAMLFAVLIGGAVNAMEILDYTLTWTLMAVVSTCVLIFAALFLPETQPASERAESRTVSQTLKGEFAMYKEVLCENRFAKWCILESLFYGPMTGLGGILGPIAMAYHGYTQSGSTIIVLLFGFFAAVCVPLPLATCKRFGYVTGWTGWVLSRLGLYVAVGSVPFHWTSMLAMLFMMNVSGGTMNIIQDVRLRLVGQRLNAKYNALDMIANFGSAVLTSLVYTSIFTAKPKNLFEKSAPVFFALGSYSVNYAIYWLALHSEYKKHLVQMQAETEAGGDKKED